MDFSVQRWSKAYKHLMGVRPSHAAKASCRKESCCLYSLCYPCSMYLPCFAGLWCQEMHKLAMHPKAVWPYLSNILEPQSGQMEPLEADAPNLDPHGAECKRPERKLQSCFNCRDTGISFFCSSKSFGSTFAILKQ